MSINTVSLGELLKRLYAPWEIEQLVNLTVPTLNELAAKGSAQLGGEGFRFAVRAESAEGHAYIPETGIIPTAQHSTVLQATVPPTVHIGVIQLTGLSMAVSAQDAMAFARAYDENITQTIEAMSAYKEGAMYRDGSGVLGTVVSVSGNDVVFDDVGFFREGMPITFFDETTAGATNIWHHPASAPLVPSIVDWVNKTVTFTTAPGGSVAAGDTAYISAPWQEDGMQPGTPATTYEPVGFEGSMRATGEYLGIDRSDYGNWRANELAANAPFDEDILLKARTLITQESGIPLTQMGGRFRVACHPGQQDVLFKLAIPRIRYHGGGSTEFDLGNSNNVKFGGINFSTSYLAPATTAYLGDFSYHDSLYTPNGELHIDTEYNGASLKWVANQDMGLTFAKEYHAFALKSPPCFCRIYNLDEFTRM